MPAKRRASRSVLLPVVVERVHRQIYLVRGQRVMLDTDLATLYRVSTSNLNKAVRRNLERFPQDFMFQLTEEEAVDLRFQIGISNGRRGGRRYLPFVFTEQGVAMLSAVLRSERAIQTSVLIMRAFVQFREMLITHKDLAKKIEEIERRQKRQGQRLQNVCTVVMQLIERPAPKGRIGFGP